MNKLANRYDLNIEITKEDLFKCGFKDGGWMDDIPEPKIHYSCVLYDDIELHIEICTKNDKISFDDFNNILIFDDEFGQPYTPFYENGSSSYIKNVIDSYNKKMDEFVEKGIFIHKASYEIHTNNKVKIKKKS